MKLKKYFLNEHQIERLAQPLVNIINEFYKDIENEEEFNKWVQKSKN